MEYNVVDIKTGRKRLLDTFATKKQAEMAIVNTIFGEALGGHKEEALKCYQTMVVKPVK